MVFFETGRYSLYDQRKTAVMKYWLKVLKTNNCILKSCYDALVKLNSRKPNCKTNWVYHIKHELCSLGFGYVWKNQCVLNENNFFANIPPTY